MLVKVSEASGPVLDWMVAKCEGREWDDDAADSFTYFHYDGQMHYSTDWTQGGPIIEQEGITLVFCSGDLGEPRSYWAATAEQQGWQYGYGPYHEQDDEKSLQTYKNETVFGPTPLIAAMRAYVMSKLGEEVEVPDELVK